MVVAVHPERRSCDIVYCDTALPVGEVQVAGWVASDGGLWNVPSVEKPQSLAQQASPHPTGRHLVALVDSVGGRPIIVGFTSPAGNQMAFTEQDRTVQRHSSGAYTTIAPDGSIEVYHPSGSYLRIGTGAHQDLTEISHEAVWKEVQDAAQPTITLHTSRFSLSVDPSGNVSLDTRGTLTMHSDGAMTLTSNGAVVIKGSTIDLNPP